MQETKLFRRRFIPNECIALDKDYIHVKNDNYMITSWKCIKPKKDRAYGSSMFLFKEGLKISKFYDHDKKMICWYCDIMTYEVNSERNELYTIDLLADVIIYPDGSYKVVDLDELADAKEQGLITDDYLNKSLKSLNYLLHCIYDGTFQQLQSPLDDVQNPWDVLEN